LSRAKELEPIQHNALVAGYSGSRRGEVAEDYDMPNDDENQMI